MKFLSHKSILYFTPQGDIWGVCYVYLDDTRIARFMGPTWGRQDPGGPHVGHRNRVIWVNVMQYIESLQGFVEIPLNTGSSDYFIVFSANGNW